MLKVEHEQSPQKIRFWDFPLEMKVREEAPAHTSQEARDAFDRIVAAGVFPSGSTEGRPMLVVIGLDFGTSSTKIIVRLPVEAGEPTVAIPAPAHCLSENHPYLWQTVLWVRGNGEFIPYPDQGVNLLRALKQGIMGQNIGTPANGVPQAEATVAYLAYVIRYVRGWLVCNRSDLFRGRNVNWLVNLGLPAADYDNEPLIRGYRKAAAAALMLTDSRAATSVETARKIFTRACERSRPVAKEGPGFGNCGCPRGCSRCDPIRQIHRQRTRTLFACGCGSHDA